MNLRFLRTLLPPLALVLGCVLRPASARAGEDEALDVDLLRAHPRSSRLLSLEWNPLPLFTLGKISGNIVFVPVSHHALVLSPFHTSRETVPIYVYGDAGHPKQSVEQKLSGFGTEIGYRYYSAQDGPRGFFLSPSVILGTFAERALDGRKSRFFDLGVAADAGYELLLGERVSLTFGAGLQYVWTGGQTPRDQLPAPHANAGALAPRFLLSLGWAF